jgi:hypothetical protein
MPEHVRVGLEPKLGLDACPFDHAGELPVRAAAAAERVARRRGVRYIELSPT